MLFPMAQLVAEYDVKPNAIIHIGAHLGEEAPDYARAGVKNVLWLEANPDLIGTLTLNVSQHEGQSAVHAVVSDKDNEPTDLRLASFSMSSSILDMKRHLDFYPTILEIGRYSGVSVTVDTLLDRLDISHNTYDMANIDVEGAELLVLKGMTETLKTIKWIYAEVNYEEMYKDCALIGDVDAFLGNLGFKRILLQDAYIGDSMMGFGDALYSR